MNRRKISAMLAVALITTQVQGVTFADTKNGNQENNKVNEEIAMKVILIQRLKSQKIIKRGT